MSHKSKNSIIEGCGFHHVTVQTRDWEESLRLYQDVLGMELVAEFGSPERKVVLLDIGDGNHIELFAPTGDTPSVGAPAISDPIVHFALATTDTVAALEHIRQAGYEITMGPKVISMGDSQAIIGFLEGPNGEAIEFFQID